mmetsp:Transcript_81796/g.162842  ORF Transcript_81796/g.162842 Transcript_81796/m.162842 type:complete len:89 (-) Transcript_81796:572-838(-)
MRPSSAFCTAASEAASRAEVASSNKRSFGLRSRQRAMAILCFWPPLSLWPRSPTLVCKLSSNDWMKLQACAALAAASTSSSPTSCGQP